MSFIHFMLFTFYLSNLESSEILALLYGFLSGFNWKIRKQLGTMQCVKLNLYFFFRNIVYKYLFVDKITGSLN